MPKAAVSARTRSARRGIAPTKGRGAAVRKYVNTSNAANAALIDPNKPLTEMQIAFVRYWAQGETLLMASYKAGYKDNGTYAYRMARMPNILALYQQEKLAYERVSEMSRKKVMDGFIEAIDMARMVGEPTTMVAGWREIAKMCGYFAPVEIKQTITHEGKIVLDRLNQLSDEDLLKLIETRATEIAGHPEGASNASIAESGDSR